MASAPTGNTALIVADVQVGILQMALQTEEAIKAYVQTVNSAIAAAREANVLVIFIRVAFRPGHPEASANNKMFSGVKANNIFVDGTESTQLHPSLDVGPTDIVLTKCRFGPFSTTQLRTILIAHNVSTLVVAGISTSGVVLNTVVEGADMDYKIVVLSDSVADGNATAHDALIQHVFPRRAYVQTTAEWVSSLTSSN